MKVVLFSYTFDHGLVEREASARAWAIGRGIPISTAVGPVCQASPATS